MDALDELLMRVDAGELGDPLPVLAYIAGQAVEIEDGGSERRAGAARSCSSPPAATRTATSTSTTGR